MTISKQRGRPRKANVDKKKPIYFCVKPEVGELYRMSMRIKQADANKAIETFMREMILTYNSPTTENIINQYIAMIKEEIASKKDDIEKLEEDLVEVEKYKEVALHGKNTNTA